MGEGACEESGRWRELNVNGESCIVLLLPIGPQFTLYFDSAAKERSPALAPGP